MIYPIKWWKVKKKREKNTWYIFLSPFYHTLYHAYYYYQCWTVVCISKYFFTCHTVTGKMLKFPQSILEKLINIYMLTFFLHVFPLGNLIPMTMGPSSLKYSWLLIWLSVVKYIIFMHSSTEQIKTPYIAPTIKWMVNLQSKYSTSVKCNAIRPYSYSEKNPKIWKNLLPNENKAC